LVAVFLHSSSYCFFNSGLRESLRSSMLKLFDGILKDDPRVGCPSFNGKRTWTRISGIHWTLATK